MLTRRLKSKLVVQSLIRWAIIFLARPPRSGAVGSSASVPGKAGVVAACCFAAAWPNPQTRPETEELRKADAKEIGRITAFGVELWQ